MYASWLTANTHEILENILSDNFQVFLMLDLQVPPFFLVIDCSNKFVQKLRGYKRHLIFRELNWQFFELNWHTETFWYIHSINHKASQI